ncbi:MAG: hypothetical protein ACFFB3_06240 [Candidatus Hodarchaeota archaeon]
MVSIDLKRTIPPILAIGGLIVALILHVFFELTEIAFLIFAISAFIGVFHFSKAPKNS